LGNLRDNQDKKSPGTKVNNKIKARGSYIICIKANRLALIRIIKILELNIFFNLYIKKPRYKNSCIKLMGIDQKKNNDQRFRLIFSL